MGLDYWNWLYNKMKGEDTMEVHVPQSFGTVTILGMRVKIGLHDDIYISGNNGKWENTIALADLPSTLATLNFDQAQQLARELQAIIDRYRRDGKDDELH